MNPKQIAGMEQVLALISERDAKIAELQAEVDRCHARLEIDHHWKFDPDTDDELVRVEVPMDERDKQIDGIECRDATIAELERQLAMCSNSKDDAHRTDQENAR